MPQRVSISCRLSNFHDRLLSCRDCPGDVNCPERRGKPGPPEPQHIALENRTIERPGRHAELPLASQYESNGATVPTPLSRINGYLSLARYLKAVVKSHAVTEFGYSIGTLVALFTDTRLHGHGSYAPAALRLQDRGFIFAHQPQCMMLDTLTSRYRLNNACSTPNIFNIPHLSVDSTQVSR